MTFFFVATSYGESGYGGVCTVKWLVARTSIQWSSSSSSSTTTTTLGPSANAPEAPQPEVYCATLNILHHRFSSPVSLIKRQRSLTEAVLISFGFTNSSPKTM